MEKLDKHASSSDPALTSDLRATLIANPEGPQGPRQAVLQL